MSFMTGLKAEANEYDLVQTENGAYGYRTTQNPLVDINFKVTSFRNTSEKFIVEAFKEALDFDKELAMRWLFFVRDVRGGLGERRFFRAVMSHLAHKHTSLTVALLPLLAEYGRWDDVIVLFGENKTVDKAIIKLLNDQLVADIKDAGASKPISLLAKWMPSLNAGKASKSIAKKLAPALGLTSSEYRRTLSFLRMKIGIVETLMSQNKWREIDYEAVPSKANVLYNKAFFKHDESRRLDFVSKVEKGEAKINSSTNFPHDIVHKYLDGHLSGWGNHGIRKEDKALEVLWKALPDLSTGSNTLVVADTSGSMTSGIGNTNLTNTEVCYALAIYFAEHAEGEFHNKVILFSSKPQYIDLSDKRNLMDKLNKLLCFNECSNTDIAKTFDLILTTAIKHNLSQEDLPKNILVMSDMEFDCATTTDRWSPNRAPLFKSIAKKFADAGYQMPRLVFWNLSSRTGAIPLTMNENGVALISGYSVNLVRMVMSEKLDVFDALKEQLLAPRYDAVGEVVKATM